MIQGFFRPIGRQLLKIQKTEGHYVYLSDTEKLYDCQAGGSANMLGHNIAELNNIKSQNFTSDWDFEGPAWQNFEIELRSILSENYTLFIPQLTGSDAIDTAIRLGWAAKGKGKFIVRPNSYHSGSIVGWQISDRKKEFTDNWLQYDWFAEAPTHNCSVDIDHSFKKHSAIGLIADTTTWSNGIEQADHEYWLSVKEVVTKNNGLFIADEVFTGMGKMGYWSHFLELGIEPDILVLGKMLTAGHEALAVVCVHKDIVPLLEDKWLASGNTKAFNECGAAIATKTIQIIKRDKLLDRVNLTIKPFLESLCNDINITKKVKAKTAGILLGLDFGDDYMKSARFQKRMRQRGYWQRTWKHLYFHIFYTVTDVELIKLRKDILEVLESMS